MLRIDPANYGMVSSEVIDIICWLNQALSLQYEFYFIHAQHMLKIAMHKTDF